MTKIQYILNNFNTGGAENGLAHLMKSNFFSGVELKITGLFKGSGALLPVIKALGGNAEYLIPQKDMSIFKLSKAFLKLRQSIRAYRPDILILSLPQAVILGRLASLGLGCRVAVFEHNVAYDRAIYKTLLKWTRKFTDVVLYDSAITKVAIEEFYAGHSVVWAYVPLVSVSSKHKQRSYRLSDTIRILSTGRLAAQKNFLEAIRALFRLKQEGIVFEYTIAGDGPERDILESEVRKLGLDGQVNLPGFVDWSALREKTDIYLQPSVREGLCISVVEAMADGLPVVASNVGGMKEYGVDGINMSKLEEPSSEEIFQTLYELIGNEKLRAGIGKRAAIDAHALFGKHAVQEKLSDACRILEALHSSYQASSPLVSVVIPAYNAEEYIALAIKSILTQTFRNFEIIVVNDASSDNTAEIIRNIDDPRIKLSHNRKNLGIAGSLNRGIAIAKGKYIARMDADDVSLPERLWKQVDIMEKDAGIGVLGTGAWHMDESGRVMSLQYPPAKHDEIMKVQELEPAFYHPSCMIRRELLMKYSYSPETVPAEDFDLWRRLSAITIFANIPEPLIAYRILPSSLSKQKMEHHALQKWQVVVKQTPEVEAIPGGKEAYVASFLGPLSNPQVSALIRLYRQLDQLHPSGRVIRGKRYIKLALRSQHKLFQLVRMFLCFPILFIMAGFSLITSKMALRLIFRKTPEFFK